MLKPLNSELSTQFIHVMPKRDFTTLCKDAMAAPLPIGSSFAEPEIEEITIFEVESNVLQQQKQITIDVLVEKLAEADIKIASDLLRVSAQALEMKLSTKNAFNVAEISHTLKLRQWAEENAGRGGSSSRRNRQVREKMRKALSFDFGARCRPAHRETQKEVQNAKAKKTSGGVKTVIITKGASQDMNQKSHYFGRPSSEETRTQWKSLLKKV